MSPDPTRLPTPYPVLVGIAFGVLGALVSTLATYHAMSELLSPKGAQVVIAERFEVIGSDGKVHGVLCNPEVSGAMLRLVGGPPDTYADFASNMPRMTLRRGDAASFHVGFQPGNGELSLWTRSRPTDAGNKR